MILVSFLSLLLQQPVLGITSYVETKWEMYWLLCTRGKKNSSLLSICLVNLTPQSFHESRHDAQG